MTGTRTPRAVKVATWSELEDRSPSYALVEDVDLVIIRYDDSVSALYGRCLHRGALLSDGSVEGDNLICGVHGWDYRVDTGVSEYSNDEWLQKFDAWVAADDDAVYVDGDAVAAWAEKHPQPYDREAYLGLYQDVHGTPVEPYNKDIQHLAQHGLDKVGHHGKVSAMGVPLTELPRWNDVQILTAQLATKPLLDEMPVGTDLVIGANAANPLHLDIPLFVSDMSFGALSEEAKTALARGAERAGTGICSLDGEGGMLPEEKAENSRYMYELASARFGWSLDKVRDVQAFHFKGGQGAKTGTGGHLPGPKVMGKIAEVRGLEPGRPAISPSTFPDISTVGDYREIAHAVREESGGIPIGFKLSAQHIVPPDISTVGDYREIAHASVRRAGGSPSGSNSRPSTSRPTSTSRSRSGSTTSSSTGGAGPPVPRPSSSRTTFPCRRFLLWPERVAISTRATRMALR